MTGPMHRPGPTHAGGAVWCDQHRRWECSKNAQTTGQRCHSLAITGTDACRMHAGVRSEVARARGEAASAWQAVAGQTIVSAPEAVLAMLQLAWLRAGLYGRLLRDQVEREGGSGEPGGDGAGGLIGHVYSSTKDGDIFATSEAVRGLAKLEAEERDRCVRFAKTAHDMGIAEAQVRLAERQGELLAGAVRAILDELGLSADQRARVPDVVPRVLRAVAAGETAGGGGA